MKEFIGYDSWKRPVYKEVDSLPEPQPEPSKPKHIQHSLGTVTYKDATPQEVAEWHEKEGKWWADRALPTVAIASVLQCCSLGFMLLSFYLLDKVF